MRKLIVVALVFISFASTQGQVKNLVKANLFSPLLRTGSFFYERTLSESSSLTLGFLFTSWGFGDSDITGWAVTPEYRFYLSDKPAPEGFYIAPYLRYTSLSLTAENADGKAELTGVGGGLLIGRQWIFKERISLDLFIGPSYTKGDLKIKSGAEEDFDVGVWDGFGVRPGVTLGIAF